MNTENLFRTAVSLNALPSVGCFVVQYRLSFIETNILSAGVHIEKKKPTQCASVYFTSQGTGKLELLPKEGGHK